MRPGLVVTLLLVRVCVVAGLVLLAGCSGSPRRQADAVNLDEQARHESLVAAMDHWSLVGKIAVSDGRDGGSGRFEWVQRGESFSIEMRAPVSRQTWRLEGGPAGVALHGLEGGIRTGLNASELLEREIGWSLPISDLRAWARGARGPDAAAALEFDPQGRVEQIRQHGWTIDYRAWHEGAPRLPRKVFASNGDRRVRLIVERWDAVAPAG